MSHSMLFIKFEGGNPVGVDLSLVREILIRRGIAVGQLGDGFHDIAVPSDGSGDTLIGELSICLENGLVTELSIDRPRYRDPYSLLAFDLITEVGFAMFSSGGEKLYASRREVGNLPEELVQQAQCTDLDVTAPSQLL